MTERDPIKDAQAAGLCYITDSEPGIRRRRAGRGFSYRWPDGDTVRDKQVLERIAGIGIPPAWNDVWISPAADGHLQATGRDVRGRKQYRYHQRWRSLRDAAKYDHMLEFAAALPEIRRHVEEDLNARGLSRRRVAATVIRLLETTLIRVGNTEYARENRSFGLTTLRDRHVSIKGSRLHFRFRGKSGKSHEIELRDRRLARIVQRCQDIPGQELFQYHDDDGNRQTISSTDVNEYLRESGGAGFTAKDFRTWAGTIITALALERAGPAQGKRQTQRRISGAIREAAEALGNTPTICRNCYIHPAVLELYAAGKLLPALQRARSANIPGLDPDESRVVTVLREAA
ncbi:MAG: DNA topoisomerase IB [Oscillochloris sp.]|nr:DNA topoisomerase IB [Oscillochloris sp.]